VTTFAAPALRASPARRRAPASTRRAPAHPVARATPRLHVGRVGALLALFTVFALVSAVVFHVVLAQNQLELDHLNSRITTEQRTYEQRRLATSLLASPQRVIQEAQRLGLIVPPEPPTYLEVPNAPMPDAADGSSTTIADWSKTKPSLDPRQP
jgi:cell division protein FtsL